MGERTENLIPILRHVRAGATKRGGTLFSAFGGAWCVLCGSGFVVGTLYLQLLLQFYADPFETLKVFC